MKTKIRIVAHRGESAAAPENTLESLALAWLRKDKCIEGDFHLPRDGEVVCMHDANAKRTCGVDRMLADMTLAEVKRLDAGLWKGEEWRSDPSRAALARHLTPNRDRLVLLDYDKEVALFGLTPLYYPGHTPGHTVFKMTVSRDKAKPEKTIWFVGDIVHAGELQIPRPQFCARFDREPETAVKSRRELLQNAPVWHGAHLPFPGVVRVSE